MAAFTSPVGWRGPSSSALERNALCDAAGPARVRAARTVTMATGVDDKAEVREYFNSTGFDRWNRIYSEDGEVNSVQKEIRVGHNRTVDSILKWVDEDGDISGKTVCDAGCGVGSLSLPLAERGAVVSASDISDAMVNEAKARAAAANLSASFEAADLEALSGSYDTVCCIDVMIHYPDEKMEEMLSHLSSLAENRMIISFAPKTFALSILKKVGEFFPGPSKATRAYLHAESDILATLDKLGWTVRRNDFSNNKFYFSRLLEVVKKD